MRSFLFILLLFLNCAFETTHSMLKSGSKESGLRVHFFSTDRVLVEIICESIENTLKGKCISDIEFESLKESEEILEVFIETQIKNSSSDYFINSGKSLLTLTLGVFLTTSAEVEFVYYIKTDSEENKTLSSSGRIGHWGVLPVYTGFIATNLGTFLNTYRRPDHLQRYCLYEDPGSVRQVMEAKKEDYCRDYQLFLKDSFYKIENEFFQTILDERNGK